MNFNIVFLVDQSDFSELVNMNEYDFHRATVIVIPDLYWRLMKDDGLIRLDKNLTNEKLLGVFIRDEYNVFYHSRVFTTENYSYYSMNETMEFDNE